ncbi:hypothetical protein [Desulforhopalus sp. 52FAK]
MRDMNVLLKDMQSYVKDTIGLNVVAKKWRTDNKMPRVLSEFCTFFEVEILGVKYLLMTISSSKESSPIYAKRMIDLMADNWRGEVIYLLPRVTSYNRKRLIERKISFIVPGNQLYLPICGIDLREHFKRLRVTKNTFSPSTQVILLSMLYGRLTGQVTPSRLAKKLQYTSMTMSRGLDELTSEGLFREQTEWRERIVQFDGGRKELWDAVKDRMKSPVKKKYDVLLPTGIVKTHLIDAGESALSRYNMMAQPPNPVYAVSGKTWKLLSNMDGFIELESSEPDSVVVEVWKYSPEVFSKKNLIDPVSLYLSMVEPSREDVAAALVKLITFVEEGLRNTQSGLKSS